MKATKPRKQYSRAFKLEAVGLAVRGEKPATVIARDLGISVNLLYNWKRDYLDDKEHSFPGTGHLQIPEDERVRALERELRAIREERDILKISREHFLKGPQMKYEFIHSYRSTFRVERMCSALQVSRSGYYDWLDRTEGKYDGTIKASINK